MTAERPHCPNGHGQLTCDANLTYFRCTDCDYEWHNPHANR